MRAAGHGVVVNVGSMGGRFTFPGGTICHARKHAVEAISDGRASRARYPVGLAAKANITSRRVLPDVAWDRVDRSTWPTPKAPRR